jgi:spoIIIJ-associated protein
MSESRSIEASGPDIESAITKGVTELGVSREDVIVEVLEEPGRRLLGLGAKQAKVRITVIKAPATPAPSRSAKPEQVAPAAEVVEKAERPPSQPRRAETAERKPRRERPQRAERPQQTEHADYEIEDEWGSGEHAVSDEDLAEDATVGADTLRELLRHMDIDAKVIAKRAESTSDEPQHWTLEIQGRNLGGLIGRRGETLAALQYITRLIASRDLERRANIVIDVEGYKSRRETMLRRLAKRMADQALQRGRTVSLEPMPPHERRIIHLALRDNPNVTTESVGEGEHRKVTIIPRRDQ